MGVVNIENLTTIKYRTDCFASGYNKHHIRKTNIEEPVTFGKGTSGEFIYTYKPYYHSYNKYRDVNAVLPNESQISMEIGYGISGYSHGPLIADKLIVSGDLNLGDMNYSSLMFEKPAIGLGSYNTGQAPDGSFRLYDEIYPSGSNVMASGKTYIPNSGYTTFNNATIDTLANDIGEKDPLHPIWDYYPAFSASRVGLNRIWVFSYDPSGQTDPSPFYSDGGDVRIYTQSALISRYVTSSAFSELQNVIENEYQYGGIALYSNQFDWNTDVWGVANHGHLGIAGSQYDGCGFTYGYLTYLYCLIIPFISENEYQAAYSMVKNWSSAEKTAFDNAYDA